MSDSFIISTEALAGNLNTPGLVILDCRGSFNSPQAGALLFSESHIPGARKIEFSTDITGTVTPQTGRTPLPERHQFAARMRELGINNDSTVILYDDGRFHMAPRVWFTLRWMGLADVRVLDGGFKAWTDANLPVTADITENQSGSFEARPSLETVIETPAIEENLTSKMYRMIDARGYAGYSGARAGADPVAGHIPGSVSRPNSENLTSTGFLRDISELREEFLELAQGDDHRIVHTCGSGVLACGNYLVTKEAGLNPAGLYVGSFSQWIRNPAHPVSTEDED